MGLYSLTVAEIIPYCQNILAMMAGSGNFATPTPPLADVDLAVVALDKAYKAALDGGKSLTATMQSRREEVFNIMRPLRDYVNVIGGGNEEILNTSGFPLADLPSSHTLVIPGDIRTKTLQGKGNVEVRCDRVDGASSYQVRYRLLPKESTLAEAVDDWTYADPIGPTNQQITGLASATYYAFQMRAIGSGKPSPWSGSVNGLPA